MSQRTEENLGRALQESEAFFSLGCGKRPTSSTKQVKSVMNNPGVWTPNEENPFGPAEAGPAAWPWREAGRKEAVHDVILFELPVFDPNLVFGAHVMNDEEKLRRELVDQAEATLHRLGRDMKLPGDVVDEAIDLLRGQVLHRFRSRKDWDQVKFPDAYLQTAARRAILRALYRAKRRGRALPADPKMLEALRKPQVTSGEILAKVAKGMKVLTSTEFKVMNLVLRNYTLMQVALTLDLTAGAVYVHVCNARKKMRQIWNDSA